MKSVVYKPFKGDIPVFDTESACITADTDISKMTLKELMTLKKESEEALFDWETIIDIELGSNTIDIDGLRNDRRQAQKLRIELRLIKERIRMMKTNEMRIAAS